MLLGAMATAQIEVARLANHPMTDERKAAIKALGEKRRESAELRSEKSANKKAASASGMTWKAYKKSLKKARRANS